MRKCLRLTVLSSLAAAILIAQDMDARRGFLVRGEISPISPGSGMLTVELSPNGGGVSESVAVHPDGTFEIRSVNSGVNGLRVLGAGGMVLYQETVILSDSNHLLSIRLPESRGNASRTAESSVSIRQLAHKVPPRARKAFDQGARAEKKGNQGQAEEFFRQAVSIDPEFADSFNELGAIEVRRGNLEQAIDYFQKAIDADPDHRLALSNMSIALAKARKFDEAAVVARRALQIQPGSSTLRYVLATSLLYVKGDSEEVLENFERSAGEVPMAHLMAAELLARRGKRTEAMHHVQEYLKAVPSDDKHKEQAEAMLAELRS